MVGPAANLNASIVPPTRGVLVAPPPPAAVPFAKLTAGAAAAPGSTVCTVGSGAGLKKLNVVKPLRTVAGTIDCGIGAGLKKLNVVKLFRTVVGAVG